MKEDKPLVSDDPRFLSAMSAVRSALICRAAERMYKSAHQEFDFDEVVAYLRVIRYNADQLLKMMSKVIANADRGLNEEETKEMEDVVWQHTRRGMKITEH